MPWLRNEDSALKKKLQGLLVYDENAPAGGRRVPVRFLLPADELANLSYPIIVIEHAGMYPANDREHRGHVQLPYAPEGMAQWWSDDTKADVTKSPYYASFPMPFNFDYQITVYTRFMVEHAQPLAAMLASELYLSPKFAYLTVPQDGTVRSMFVIGGPDWGYGMDEDDKRLIRITYRVRVFAELAEDVQSMQAFGGTLIPVSAVNLDLKVYSDLTDIDMNTPAEIEAHRGILSVGAGSSFNALAPPNG